MKQATFLWKNERGIYYFRARIPKQFSEYFNGSEIKKSLKTDSLRIAIKLARAYRVELDKEMDKMKKGGYSPFQVTLEGKVVAKLPDGSERLIEGQIKREICEGEYTTAYKEYLAKQLREEAERLERQAREQALFEAQLAAIQAKASTVQAAKQDIPSLFFSDVIKPYIEEKSKTSWNPKSRLCVENALKLFIEIAGDLPINSIDKKIAREFKGKYLRLPQKKAISANPLLYQGKTLLELASMDIPDGHLIDVSTVGNNIGHISTFFKWAIANDYVKANPFEGLRPKLKKRASEQRDIFDNSDLRKIFESEEYNDVLNLEENMLGGIGYQLYHYTVECGWKRFLG